MFKTEWNSLKHTCPILDFVRLDEVKRKGGAGTSMHVATKQSHPPSDYNYRGSGGKWVTDPEKEHFCFLFGCISMRHSPQPVTQSTMEKYLYLLNRFIFVITPTQTSMYKNLPLKLSYLVNNPSVFNLISKQSSHCEKA